MPGKYPALRDFFLCRCHSERSEESRIFKKVLNMNRKLIAFGMLFGVAALIIVLYIVSAVLHRIPENIALIIGLVIAVPDSIIAMFILTRPDKPDNQ